MSRLVNRALAVSLTVMALARSGTAQNVRVVFNERAPALVAPLDVALDAADQLVCAGGSVFRLQPGGVFRKIIGPSGDGQSGAVQFPLAPSFDSEGNLYVVGTRTDNVLWAAHDGTVEQILGPDGDRMGNELRSPSDVAVDREGNVFVAADDRVFRRDTSGVVSVIFEGNIGLNTDIAVDAAGNVYFDSAEGQGGQIWRVSPAGVVDGFAPLGVLQRFWNTVTSDPLGNVYYPNGVTVTRILSDGSMQAVGMLPGNAPFFAASSAGTVFGSAAVTRLFTFDETGERITIDVPSLPRLGRMAIDADGTVYATTFSLSSTTLLLRIRDATILDLTSAFLTSGLSGFALDGSGSLWVAARDNNALLNVALDTLDVEVLIHTPADETAGVQLLGPGAVAVDAEATVYVAGEESNNVVARDLDGELREMIRGDGNGNELRAPSAIAVDAAGVVFVAGAVSDNVFQIEGDGSITEIIDADGDGVEGLDTPVAVAVDAAGNVVVAGRSSNNVFRIDTAGEVGLLLGPDGDGTGNLLSSPQAVVTDSQGNVYVAGAASNNVFRISGAGAITQVLDGRGDGLGNALGLPGPMAVDGDDNVFVVGRLSQNIFRIRPDGRVSVVFRASVSGYGTTLQSSTTLAADEAGRLYVAATGVDQVIEIAPADAACTGDCNGDGRVTVDEIVLMVTIALGDASVTQCEAGDASADGTITVDEILAAIGNALSGCPV